MVITLQLHLNTREVFFLLVYVNDLRCNVEVYGQFYRTKDVINGTASLAYHNIFDNKEVVAKIL